MLATFALPAADRATSAAPVRAPTPTPGPRFADMLPRGPSTHGVLARPADPPPAAQPTEPAAQTQTPADEGADDATPSQAQATARSARLGPKAALRSREKAPLTTPAEAPAPDAATAAGAGRPRAADDGPGAMNAAIAPPPAELRDWLAALKLSAGADTPTGAGANDLTTTRAGLLPAQTDAPCAERDDPAGGDALAAAEAPPALPNPMPAAESRAAPADALPHGRDAGPPQTLPGAAGALAPRGFDFVAAPTPLALPTPLHAPEFAQLLGVQVSVLARDGVQQAELHLNPAEMGPIRVQIEIDGAQARVDFSADAAGTREVIERGLPELAAALREQGLTLSGGGVFQQPPDRRNPHDGSAASAGDRLQRSAQQATDPTPGTVARQIAIAQGRLDVYA